MKYKTVFAAAFLLCAVTIAAAIPDQPFMQAARADLQTAKRELQRATANKGGHRGKAIALVNQAIAQVNQGIDYDRRHNHAVRVAGAPDQPRMTTALAASRHLRQGRTSRESAGSCEGRD
ncbi:MAG TPA: hypothetical protein VFX97_08330 [Pyrinomonadaceae bacterium]|nr:hypothetical protein [Pyrinomonadaceae bacterium]